jgi:ribosomal protein S18 acetylase RimI-like enzyme
MHTTEELRPGHYWKTPFVWETGRPEPESVSSLTFETAEYDWLVDAVAQTMAASLDETDRFLVSTVGASKAAAETLEMALKDFENREGWWRVAKDIDQNSVGFLMPVLFKGEKFWKEGRPVATIFYIGVLPQYRGLGYVLELLNESIRICQLANCWQIWSDTGTDNHPMVQAFRKAGFLERLPRQQPVA